MIKYKCPNCGYVNDDAADICLGCGYPIANDSDTEEVEV